MKYSIDWLKRQHQNEEGEEIKYFFFWGHTPKKRGAVDKSCLSQWFPSPFIVRNVQYHTAEHWMMMHKAKLFNDEDAVAKMMATNNPAVAKSLGRTVRNFDKAIWDAHAFNIVVEGNYHKFSQNEALGTYLLNTGKKVIVEASPQDAIWGIGLDEYAKGVMHPNTWRGTNLLGFALMEARDKLLDQSA